MEQFLLNPDVAVQQTPQSKSVSDGTIAKDESDFNPVLQEAVANQEGLGADTGTTAGNGQGTPRGAEENQATALNMAVQTGQIAVETNGAAIDTNSAAITSTVRNPVLQTNTSGEIIQPNLAPEVIALKQNATPITVEADPLMAGASSAKASKAETILLQQIQQIIDEGKNIGAITVKASNQQSPSPQAGAENLQTLSSTILNESEPELIQARQTTSTIQMVQTEQKPLTINTVKPESGRQDITEQFLNAKLSDSKTSHERNPGNQQGDAKGGEGQQNKAAAANPTLTATTSVADSSASETGFGQHMRAGELSSTTTTSTPIEGKYAPGSPHSVVPEKELVDHLIQRFNVNPRLQTSKLTMQLHPAELGQLKIDILVKGDSLSANIVAQSQQVLETLDKNMNRLRTVLEEQGFSIDSFEITLQTDQDKQQNLFQEHFGQEQQLAQEMKKKAVQQDDSFETVLASETNTTEQSETGVNVTA